MRQCSNCGNQITCGCQDRMASDSKLVCANCIALYEQQLINQIKTENENVPTE